jgi:hypothetical protein
MDHIISEPPCEIWLTPGTGDCLEAYDPVMMEQYPEDTKLLKYRCPGDPNKEGKAHCMKAEDFLRLSTMYHPEIKKRRSKTNPIKPYHYFDDDFHTKLWLLSRQGVSSQEIAELNRQARDSAEESARNYEFQQLGMDLTQRERDLIREQVAQHRPPDLLPNLNSAEREVLKGLTERDARRRGLVKKVVPAVAVDEERPKKRVKRAVRYKTIWIFWSPENTDNAGWYQAKLNDDNEYIFTNRWIKFENRTVSNNSPDEDDWHDEDEHPLSYVESPANAYQTGHFVTKTPKF